MIKNYIAAMCAAVLFWRRQELSVEAHLRVFGGIAGGGSGEPGDTVCVIGLGRFDALWECGAEGALFAGSAGKLRMSLWEVDIADRDSHRIVVRQLHTSRLRHRTHRRF